MTDASFDSRPLILTALPERRAFEHFQALRRLHFPPERNIVPAHITLFHHLPGLELPSIADRVKLECGSHEAPSVQVGGVTMLGRGVAFQLRSPVLEAARDALAEAWHGLLVPQDQAPYRPHVTVQNKATPETARALFADLSASFRPWTFTVEALQLWRYAGGPWEPVRRVPFARPRR